MVFIRPVELSGECGLILPEEGNLLKFCVVNFSCYLVNVLFLSVPLSTDTVIVFCPHFSLYLDNFSATFTHVFRSEGISISISVHVFFWLSLIMMSGLLALIVLLV